jgi:hypothetical protein
MDFVRLLLQVLLGTLILTPVLWIAGRILVGKTRAKFTDALWIAFLGNLLERLVSALIINVAGRLIGIGLMFLVWLGLIKHFFDC